MSETLNMLMAGDLTVVTVAIWAAVAFISGAIGGAIGGMLVGGRHIGHELAAMMGAFYGPVAALPGVFIGLVILMLI